MPFGGVDRTMNVLKDDLPDRWLAEFVACMRRLFQIDPPDHEALRKLDLQFAHARTTDGAAKPRDRRLADAGAARQFAIGRVQCKIDIGKNGLGHAPFRGTKIRRGLFNDRYDVLRRLRDNERIARARIAPAGILLVLGPVSHRFRHRPSEYYSRWSTIPIGSAPSPPDSSKFPPGPNVCFCNKLTTGTLKRNIVAQAATYRLIMAMGCM